MTTRTLAYLYKVGFQASTQAKEIVVARLEGDPPATGMVPFSYESGGAC